MSQTDDIERAIELIKEGLCTEDGGHHKQWYLEQIAEALGYDLQDLRREIMSERTEEAWEPGIAP